MTDDIISELRGVDWNRDTLLNAADEIERLRAELAAVRKQHDANGNASRDRAEHIYKLRTKLNAAEAERDALRALLRSAVMQLPEHRRARFEDALKGDGDE